MTVNLNSDFHIHTALCRHASGEMHEYVEQAIALGLKEIAFTDHIPLPNGFDWKHRMDEKQLEGYVNAVQALQATYPQIKIRLGIEADFYDGFENYLERTIRTYPFEVIILSVHFIRDWPEGNWVFHYHFPHKNIGQIYSEYLQALLRGIQTGLFNVVGHLDLIKREGHPLLKHNETEVRQVLKAAAQAGMAVEINTSGLRKAIGEPYPHASLWPLIAEYDLPVTLGSDAHAPEQVGFAFSRVVEDLARIPNLKYARFAGRKILPAPFVK
jgi:histidinol-phosphatase (PHP family)